jgi:ABC-type glycerol-3-phosphate transport system substrate-binding protein
MDSNLPSQTPPQTMPQAAAPPPVDPYYGNGKNGGGPLKKIILLVLGIVILILLVVGGIMLVGKLQSSSKPKDVTLQYWGLWDDASVMQPVIADFERTHPHIKIQYEKQDIKGLGKYVKRLTTRIDDNTGPDIYRFHSSWTYQLRNYLLPFPQSIVKDTKLETDYYKTVQRDMKLNGAYYGIPLGVDTLAMFVNTQALQSKGLAIPKDWNDIYVKYAPELVVKDQSGKIITSSISLGTYDNIAHAPDIVALLMLQNGANIKDLAGDAKGSAVDALKFYTSFADGDKAVWDPTLDNSTLAFAKGNLALYFGYSWDVYAIKALNPNLQFQIVKVPTLAGRNNTVASYWSEGVSSKTKNSKEAFEFIDYLSKPETLQKLYQTQSKVRLFGTLYPRRSMAPLLSSNDLVYPFILQADDAQSTYFSSDTYDGESGMITQMNVYMGNAVRSVNNHTSAETAIDTLSSGVATVLSQHAN